MLLWGWLMYGCRRNMVVNFSFISWVSQRVPGRCGRRYGVRCISPSVSLRLTAPGRHRKVRSAAFPAGRRKLRSLPCSAFQILILLRCPENPSPRSSARIFRPLPLARLRFIRPRRRWARSPLSLGWNLFGGKGSLWCGVRLGVQWNVTSVQSAWVKPAHNVTMSSAPKSPDVAGTEIAGDP